MNNSSSSQPLPSTTPNPNVEDRLARLTEELFGKLEPDLQEEWRKVYPQVQSELVTSQVPMEKSAPTAVLPSLTHQWKSPLSVQSPLTTKSASAKKVALKKWQDRLEPGRSEESTTKKRRSSAQMQQAKRAKKESVHQQDQTKSLASSISTSEVVEEPAKQTTCMQLNSENPTMVPSSSEGSSTNSTLYVDPLVFLMEMYESDFATNIVASNPNAQTLKQKIYKKLFHLHVSYDLSKRSDPLLCNDLYLVALSALEYLGLISS